MAENPSDGAADNEKAHMSAADGNGDEAVSNLPMVVAPKLGAGEEDVIDEPPGESAEATAAPPAPVHSSRFLMLAASVAFAAAFGSFFGSVSGSGLVRFLDPAAPVPTVQTTTTEAARQSNLELAALTALKTNLDNTSRSTSAQLAKLSERLDKLDQRSAAVETTGSIATASAAPAAPPASPKIADRVLQDWIVQDVQRGRALLQNRSGGMFDVGEGSMLPGLGRIDAIKRQDGQWIVLTERGTIVSGR
ncbi:MAG TPA: hypothetical protein VL048_16375 [Xanthobacteraceae bacterium]|nr:hypothetical protein [Xanthobacteraceae bacterium]